MKKKHKQLFSRIKLTFSFSVAAFTITSASIGAISTFFRFVHRADFLDFDMLPPHIAQTVLAAISLIIGIILSLIFRKLFLKPLYTSYDALDRIAKGDYDVHIQPRGVHSIAKVAKEINTTAKELKSVEIMRNDFINNFSHEFKTPIVSIEGFARMLKDETLSEKEREEYLDIIISEAHRLSELSTNILTLNRLENLNLLTDIKLFNVSEQIRLCVVLLENKWSTKNIGFSFDGNDYEIFGNEALMHQLWINIIDNAIKYSSHDSEIEIKLKKKDDFLTFSFIDHGKGMTQEEIKHAFDRFYQGDMNHKTSGNGIGLAVAKKICDLHEGTISIHPTDGGGTTVEVKLPI